MGERNFELKMLNPVILLGANNQNLEIICNLFPKLKIYSRDNFIRFIGNDEELDLFEAFLVKLQQHCQHNESLNNNDIVRIFQQNSQNNFSEADAAQQVIVHGQNGIIVKARTPNQQKMVSSFEAKDLIFAIGPAGTGKTYTAVALAVRALKNKEVRRIILTRPAVEAGENLGFLPGDLKEKLDPYMQPLYDALWEMIPTQKLTQYIEDRIIEIAPLAFMRGRTLDNAVVILDEAQNSTISQMKMFLTRLGRSAKFIVTGDITQIDLPKNQTSGLIHAVDILKNIQEIDFVFLDNTDIVRHKLVSKIIQAYHTEK